MSFLMLLEVLPMDDSELPWGDVDPLDDEGDHLLFVCRACDEEYVLSEDSAFCPICGLDLESME